MKLSERQMVITEAKLKQIMPIKPGARADRIILDPRGIHHGTVPAGFAPPRNFAQEVAIHRNQSNLDVAESLYIIQHLRKMGAVRANTIPKGQGAVVQAFRGNTIDHKGCHTMPCQLVLDSRFPHQLSLPREIRKNGRFNSAYIHRIIKLFARCTWTPNVVNGMDQLLDWSPHSNFVSMYLGAVTGVLHGKDPNAMYQDFAGKRGQLLGRLANLTEKDPLSYHEAMILMSVASLEPGGESGMTAKEVEALLADQGSVDQLKEQRHTVLEVYADCDHNTPHAISSGQLQETVDKESKSW